MAATQNKMKKYFNEEELVLPSTALPGDKRIYTFDAGGSLFKLAYTAGGRNQVKIKMVTFSSLDLSDAATFIREEIIGDDDRTDVKVVGTGIGRWLFLHEYGSELGISQNDLTDEFACFGKGLHYMLTELNESAYLYPYEDPTVPTRSEFGMNAVKFVKVTEEEEHRMREKQDTFPALLVFCGSGLGYILVDEDGSVNMIGGSLVAGSAFHSIGKLLTGAETYDELMEFARNGDSTVCTTTVKDLNVDEYANMNLASFNEKFVYEILPFGNIVMKHLENPRKEDLARSLLHMIGSDIVYSVFSFARAYKLNKCYLAGSFFADEAEIAKQFIRDRLPMITNIFAWPVYARFMKFEGYIGAIGAMIHCIKSKS
ncbi:uncharacterized protein LOC141910783 [Tubulanus polymorphus]|uniref:uncharacterized protein LOC141910783 n=1 Tax=Tubulanus polymorphus TaxID=672921 RepID=UPI003DA500FD